MNDCIFCHIITKSIPAKIIVETDDCVVIEDIAPKADIHYLIIPKKHVRDIASFNLYDASSLENMLLVIKQLRDMLPEPKAFRLITNTGKEAGQSVFHTHLHFLAGKKLNPF